MNNLIPCISKRQGVLLDRFFSVAFASQCLSFAHGLFKMVCAMSVQCVKCVIVAVVSISLWAYRVGEKKLFLQVLLVCLRC